MFSSSTFLATTSQTNSLASVQAVCTLNDTGPFVSLVDDTWLEMRHTHLQVHLRRKFATCLSLLIFAL